jgi:hypothetical protein
MSYFEEHTLAALMENSLAFSHSQRIVMIAHRAWMHNVHQEIHRGAYHLRRYSRFADAGLPFLAYLTTFDPLVQELEDRLEEGKRQYFRSMFHLEVQE